MMTDCSLIRTCPEAVYVRWVRMHACTVSTMRSDLPTTRIRLPVLHATKSVDFFYVVNVSQSSNVKLVVCCSFLSLSQLRSTNEQIRRLVCDSDISM